ncbi:tRNA lysidine(34) synthetase TilS [Candidatus Saccharibacteria bacterium]|nr:tRNA lysidine(34) synthetase TilS [Candidatus Saccharibacteria bacterium]
MKKVLAISGGVDSMALLAMLKNDPDVVVAHFDHGTRESSKDDANFVRNTAEKFRLPFFLGTAELGDTVSEATAREARYKFLNQVSKKVSGEIWTAHHINDLVESVAINILRGTGWRGLTPFSNEKVHHFFLEVEPMTKTEIDIFAANNNLSFRQDPTNAEENYLRNRLRPKVSQMSKPKLLAIYNLYQKQLKLRLEIEKILAEIIPLNGVFERKWFTDIDETVALEILKFELSRHDILATRPQILDFLNAIKTYAPEKKFNLPGGKMVTIHKTYFKI